MLLRLRYCVPLPYYLVYLEINSHLLLTRKVRVKSKVRAMESLSTFLPCHHITSSSLPCRSMRSEVRGQSRVVCVNANAFRASSRRWERCAERITKNNRSRKLISASSSSSSGVGVTVEGGNADLTEDEQDQKDIADVLEAIKVLKQKRDMSPQEIRLTLMIEDPREAERRRELGIENESGCSRDEIASALVDAYEGRIPERLALRTLAEEMRFWPRLEDEPSEVAAKKKKESPYAKVTDVGLPGNSSPSSSTAWDEAVTEEEATVEKDLSQILPNWVGYSFLYGISVVPIIIGVTVVVVLFLNSLQ